MVLCKFPFATLPPPSLLFVKLYKARQTADTQHFMRTPWSERSVNMALRQLTKTPKLCLVYFYIDKTTCIVETKKLRRKDSGEVLSKSAPEKEDKVTLRSSGKLLDAMVIAADGK